MNTLSDAKIKAVLGNYAGPYSFSVKTDQHGYHVLQLKLPRSMQGYFVPTMRQVLAGDVFDVTVEYTHVPTTAL